MNFFYFLVIAVGLFIIGFSFGYMTSLADYNACVDLVNECMETANILFNATRLQLVDFGELNFSNLSALP